MSWDIHSYFEVRDGPGAPWRLVQRARQDEDGRWDVERDEQPFRSLRSSTFFAVLTGILSNRAPIDYGRLVPIVPEDRPLADDLGVDLARIFAWWEDCDVAGPYWLTLADLEATDWHRPIYFQDAEDYGRAFMPLGEIAGWAVGIIPEMHALAETRGPEDVRLIFWLE